MAAVNSKRVFLGAIGGGIVWAIWSILVNAVILGARYQAAQKAGQMLTEPRYSFGLFLTVWYLSIFVMAYILAWLYASARATRGAGPGTALQIGVLGGFLAGFPMNFSMATWAPLSRWLPLWWMLELWVGAILAAFVAGWLYKEEGA